MLTPFSKTFLYLKQLFNGKAKKKKPCSTSATDRFFPICWIFFFLNEKKSGKISRFFWTKIGMKNCERSQQEKIMIFKLFSGNFGKKMF